MDTAEDGDVLSNVGFLAARPFAKFITHSRRRTGGTWINAAAVLIGFLVGLGLADPLPPQ